MIGVFMIYFLFFDAIFCQFNIIRSECDLRPNTCFSVPSPPLNIRLNQLRQKQDKGKTVLLADIAWDPPENSHGVVAAYRVMHKLVGPLHLIESLSQRSVIVQTISKNVTTTQYTSSPDDPLGFGKVYEFSVAAINNIDIGIETKFNVSTRESAPDMYPISIEFTGLTSQSVNISWQPPNPEHHNGVLISYQVHYFLYGLKNTTNRSVSTSKQYVQIEDLKENVLYTFQVRAFTKPGPGPWCPEINFRTAIILPDPPTNIMADRINERQMKVTWELPQNENIKVIGFKIYSCSKDEVKDIKNCNTLDVGPVTMATLGNLDSGEDYFVGIKSRAIDNRFGVISNMVSVKTSNVMKLTELSVKGLKCDAKVTSIEINWSKPDIEKDLSRFLIRINGYSSYVGETGKIQKTTRAFKVREVEYGRQFTKFIIDLKEMEPNTIYDISVHTMYKKNENTVQYGTVQNTSCRTWMARPKTVKTPEIVSLNITSLFVLFQIHRVSEILGVIRKYYLIVEDSSSAENTSLNKYSLDSLKSVQRPLDSPILVSEFSTEVFKGSSNISLWVGNDQWLSQSSKAHYVTDYILMSPMNFKTTKKYKVYLRACIYGEYVMFPLAFNNENLIPCTDSPWSLEFDFQNNYVHQPSFKPDAVQKKKHDVFTVAIIAVIVGLGIVALISIAVGCFMKRRRPKRYYNSPQELIMNGDPSLKQALISQASSAPPAYVPLSHSNGIVTDMDSSLKSEQKNYKILKNSG